ncbi:hypothetical protein CDL12_29221 [Handroanthus impetiginosus]|uniref:Uncharacterized protein n=1 Tax=Handroanthus impetiginosus TaxID=429701 RepID=A0A2G9FZD4_9LAMI|nr:hypothetical protein CDL12_29221 [Handroanthus impetiginosus]
MNRMWMAAGVAVVNGHSDQGQKLRSARHGPESADLRPFSGVLNSDLGSSSRWPWRRCPEETGGGISPITAACAYWHQLATTCVN